MKIKICRLINYCAGGLAIGSFAVGFALAGEPSERLNNPFLLPQTNIVLGNVNYTTNLSRGGSAQLDGGGVNTYGFDIEVNASQFLNIGAYVRIESISVDRSQITERQFSTVIGGFTRFFYQLTFFS